MKAVVELLRFEEGDQISMTTSCGAKVNQVLRSHSDYQQAIMLEWADEQEAARRVICEINWDLADRLLGLHTVATAHQSGWRLPQDLIEELKHRFPDLKAKWK